jgi:hypothetical protein
MRVVRRQKAQGLCAQLIYVVTKINSLRAALENAAAGAED